MSPTPQNSTNIIPTLSQRAVVSRPVSRAALVEPGSRETMVEHSSLCGYIVPDTLKE